MTEAVRALERTCADVSNKQPMLVVGCTGNADTDELMARSKEVGQDACLGKPLPANFKETVLELLRSREE